MGTEYTFFFGSGILMTDAQELWVDNDFGFWEPICYGADEQWYCYLGIKNNSLQEHLSFLNILLIGDEASKLSSADFYILFRGESTDS